MSEDKYKDYSIFNSINAVDNFDPTPFAVDYVDFNTGDTRKRLPVMVQIAWFRLKYPQGRIACTVSPGKDCFIGHARVYANYNDPVDCFLGEGSSARGIVQDKPSVSPREWAQTASIGIALRNAGFGLQFGFAGESLETQATYELLPVGTEVAPTNTPSPTVPEQEVPSAQPATVASPVPQPVTPPPAPVDPLQAAMRTPCGLSRHPGKTIGDLARSDPNALEWIMNKSKLSEEIKEAARTVVAHYASQSA